MPKIIFTGSERARVNAVLRELDPATHELTIRFRDSLAEDDWHFIVDYARTEMRAALELGLLARATVESATNRGITNFQGSSAFLRSVSWLRNFGTTDEADERFVSITGDKTDGPLFLAVDALLELARDRMFGTIDEEYRQLLDAGSP